MDEKIIKARLAVDAGVPLSTSPKMVKKDVYEAGVEARAIVAAAEERAKSIVAEAERARAAIYEAAQREGYEKGLASWNEILASATANFERLVESHESELARLSVKISEKIIGEELTSRPETIASIVAEALKSIRHERNLSIQVNPQELDQVRQHLDRLREVAGPGREIRVVADPAVTRGGCMVESELGTIDARLETQLKCLEEAFVRAGRK